MNGVEYKDFFTVRTFIAKYTSIFFVRIAGLGIGFEAAFVHIAAFLGDYFSKKEFFKELSKKEYRLAVVTSVSVSFVIAFGAPIGGVILSLELFCDNFDMHNLLKSFLAAGIAFFYYEVSSRFFNLKNIDSIFPNPTNDIFTIDLDDVTLFLGLGIFVGLVASFFLFIYTTYLEFRKDQKS